MKLRSVYRISVVCALVVGLSLAAMPAHADDDGSSVGIGVDWVGVYEGTGSPAARYGNLSTPDDCVAGLYNIVTDPNTSWNWVFNWGNSNAWELDFKRPSAGGNAARLADDVDLVAFSGHGLGNNFTFGTSKNDWYATPSDMTSGFGTASGCSRTRATS